MCIYTYTCVRTHTHFFWDGSGEGGRNGQIKVDVEYLGKPAPQALTGSEYWECENVKQI